MKFFKHSLILFLMTFSCGEGGSDHLTGKVFHGMDSQGDSLDETCKDCDHKAGKLQFKAGGYLLLSNAGEESRAYGYSLEGDKIILDSGEIFLLSEDGQSLESERGDVFSLK